MPSEIYLINLDRRPDRLAQATEELNRAGLTFIRFPAVDGGAVPMPENWTAGTGALGCSLSHRAVLRDALNRGVDSVLVFEDDVCFVPDFASRLARFLDVVPDDWDALFLGGQHQQPPTAVVPGVVRCWRTARTHAYAVRGRYLRYLLDLWTSYPGHVDHAWERHQSEWNVYAPDEWLAGQRPGPSDISGRADAERWWKGFQIKPPRISRGYPRKHHPGLTPKGPCPVKSEAKTFSHAGDLGDLIYGLPALYGLCCGVPSELVLYRSTIVRQSWTPESVERVRPFLEGLPYLSSVRFAEKPEGVKLDPWRQHWRRGCNLAEIQTRWARVPDWGNADPWATVDKPNRVASVVIHRSPRYHTRGFPWRLLVDALHESAVFVGSEAEHRAFHGGFIGIAPTVPYYRTETVLDLARVIAGADLFIGNQSAPRAVAESLKVPVFVEQDARNPDTRFARPSAWYSPDDLDTVLTYLDNKG